MGQQYLEYKRDKELIELEQDDLYRIPFPDINPDAADGFEYKGIVIPSSNFLSYDGGEFPQKLLTPIQQYDVLNKLFSVQ